MSEKSRVLILYGSQKGNAKSIAETIGESCGKYGFFDDTYDNARGEGEKL